MPPARPDIIAEGNQDVPFRERRACSGCRAIKSRCMIQGDSRSCSRCIRLQIECCFPEHHRGVKSGAAREKDETKNVNSSSSVSQNGHSKKSSNLKRSPASSNGRSPKRSNTSFVKSESQPFSIQSMLSVDPSKSTLLSSTAFATIQEDDTVTTNGARKKAKNFSSEPLDESEDIIEHLLSTDILGKEEVMNLISFYFVKLNPIIALLDPQIYTAEALITDDQHKFLLASICTASAKFCNPELYLSLLSFMENPLSRIQSHDVAPHLDYVLSLSILAMYKHPQDGTSWRKLRLAVTMALELGLQHTFNEVVASAAHSGGPRKKPPPKEFVQKQRTFLQLACFEDGYQDQRRIPMAIDRSLLPDPWQWVEWLGDNVQDIDIRLAASRENALVKQNLMRNLKRDGFTTGFGGAGGGNSKSVLTKAVAIRRIQEIEMAIAAEKANTRVWKDPSSYGMIGKTHSGRPCLLFHTANTIFNYHRALYSVYCSNAMKDMDPMRKQSVFLDCCKLSIEIFELIGGAFGEQDYFRFVHDIVILNLAVAAVWISDNWGEMVLLSSDLAAQAALAVTNAANATSSCLDRNMEQSCYLAKFLAYCCEKITLLQTTSVTMNGFSNGRHPTSDGNFTSFSHTLTGNGFNAGAIHTMGTNQPFTVLAPKSMTSPMNGGAPLSLSPDSIDMYGTGLDPSLQFLQELLSVPCVQTDEADGHNILSFFYDERKRQM